PDRRDPADTASILSPTDECRAEDDEEPRPESDLYEERRQAHGLTILARSGTVAVSTGPSAIPGTMPKSTRTKTRMTRAAHAGPGASTRSWKGGAGGPQKIGRTTRSTYTAVRSVPSTAGASHQRWSERHAPMNVSSSATNPAVAGKPSDDRPPIVNAVAMPGMTWPKPPIFPISRECAFS